MRRVELRILERLRREDLTVGELARELSKSDSWISEAVTDLEERGLVERDGDVKMASSGEARHLPELLERYDLERVLAGRREDVLERLARGPRTPGDLEREGIPASTVYEALSDLREVGAVEKTEEGYRLADEALRSFVEAGQPAPRGRSFEAGDERALRTPREDVEGRPTAFSAFQRYGVDYYPKDRYLFQGDGELEIEDVLIHAVLFAGDGKQMGMCGVFYLRHRDHLEPRELWKKASKWGCLEKWADLLAYVDRREVRNGDLFLPWDEFASLARDYEVYAPGKHPEESLLRGLETIGESLDEAVDASVDAYLLGGGNLILRDLKDTTKDIDLVLPDEERFEALAEALKEEGYVEKSDLPKSYERLSPRAFMEKQGFPRWDIFVKTVADALSLTDEMRRRSDGTMRFGRLTLHLISPTDIFLFKSITDREGDLEDAALLARREDIDWDRLIDELETQEKLSGQYFSFMVLDTLDILSERYSIEPPIHDRLESYTLERALLFTLKKPKTIRDLRKEMDFPDHRIYNKLRKLEREGKIAVDREGKLNRYRTV